MPRGAWLLAAGLVLLVTRHQGWFSEDRDQKTAGFVLTGLGALALWKRS